MLAVLLALALGVAACGDSDADAPTATAGDDASDAEEVTDAEDATDDEGPSTDSSVFPSPILDILDIQEIADIPGGGRASVGFICRGGGADLAYAGVVDAKDGLYTARAEGIPGPITFATASPDPGIGVGNRQTTLDQDEYTFDFGDLGVEITIDGCGP